MKGLLAAWGMPSRRRSSLEHRTNALASPSPKHNIGGTARHRPHPPFLAVLLGLLSTVLCSNGVGALGLATHDAVAPRHALRAQALCAAAHHAELGIEAALVELLDGDLQRSAVLRDEAKASLVALEAEWHETAAWIARAREQLTSASSRMAGLTNQHAGVTGAFASPLVFVERGSDLNRSVAHSAGFVRAAGFVRDGWRRGCSSHSNRSCTTIRNHARTCIGYRHFLHSR